MSKKVDFETYCKKLKNFPKYKSLSESEFTKKAKELYKKKYKKEEKVEVKEETLKIVTNEIGNWLSQEEADKALALYNNYKKNKEITDFADIELLKELVRSDIEIERLRKDIIDKRLKNDDKKEVFVPTYAINAINKITEQTLVLRKALGLVEEQKKKDPLQYINQLREKAKKWREKNRLQFEILCPVCKEILLLRWKIKDKDGNFLYDIEKHPFYKDKILCNEWLWQLYKQNKITKLDIAKVLFPENWKNVNVTSYVDWLEKKFFSINVSSPQEIEEFGQD